MIVRWMGYACAAVLALGVTACATTFVAAGQVERSVLAQPVAPEQMRAAIVRVLNERRHPIQGEQPGHINATMNGGGRELTLDIAYDALGFSLTPVATSGFETQAASGDGGERVERRYVVWMRRLRTLIERQLGELKDAARAQQQHELHVAEAQRQAEQAALERERLARTPTYAPGVQGQLPLIGGFNITRPPNGLGAASVVILNQGSEPIHRLVFRQTGEADWRPNQLTYTIEPGTTYRVDSVPAGRWELRIETLSLVKQWGDLTFGAGGEYTLIVTPDGWTRR